ncbi:aldehyde dehydrogenase [Candidatus Foliamicus sp.]
MDPNVDFEVRERVTSIIDGEPVRPTRGGVDFPVVNPASEEVSGVLREADAEEVDAAARSAREAFENGPWPRMGADERKAIFRSMHEGLHKHREELEYLDCLNSGVPISQVRAMHIARAAYNFEFFGEVLSQDSGEVYTQNPNFLTYVTREPVGVGAMMAPWNAPLPLASMRVATCIAFGNTCVLKPSEYTPHSMQRMVEIFHEAGLPPGVVNLVNGRGPVTGTALVNHPEVDMVGFTGGSETGKIIMSEAGKSLKPVLLELGGKSANIIHESADMERALDGALLGIFSSNGQQCLAGSRILVQRSIAREFIERFVERAKKLRIGDPLDPETEIGPLCYERHMERVLGYAKLAREEGAKLLLGGGRPSRMERGWFVEPTAVLTGDNSARICQEEIFGPFATFLEFDDLDEAIRIANDSEFGLVAYLWSQDLGVTMRAARELRAGTIWVNTPMFRELRAPFGGYKQSGIGRDGARGSLEFFTEPKTVSIPQTDFPMLKMGN